MALTVDVVLRSYPVTTQTFHYQRLAEFARLGVLGTVWLESEADGHVDPGLEAEFGDRVRMIDSLPMPRPSATGARLLTEAVAIARPGNGEGGPAGAVKQTLSGLRLGAHLAETGPSIIHAPFSTANATIARAASKVSGVPFSVEVHSPLSWFRNPGWFRAKVADAAVVAVISDYCRKRTISICPEVEDRTVEVHCGLPPVDDTLYDRGPAEVSGFATSVGGLVDKKGHDVFIRACALSNQPGRIVGGGPLRSDLEGLIERLDAPVTLAGELPHSEALEVMRASDVGVLAARGGADGDEDGVPVVLLEYMRDGVPVVSTSVGGIPSLLRRCDLVTAVDDEVALCAAIREGRGSRRASPAEASDRIQTGYDALTESTTLLGAIRFAVESGSEVVVRRESQRFACTS